MDWRPLVMLLSKPHAVEVKSEAMGRRYILIKLDDLYHGGASLINF